MKRSKERIENIKRIINAVNTMEFEQVDDVSLCTNEKQIVAAITQLGVQDINQFYTPYDYIEEGENSKKGINIFLVYHQEINKFSAYFFQVEREKQTCLRVDDIRNNPDFVTISKHFKFPVLLMFAFLTNALYSVPIFAEQAIKFIEVDFQKYFENLVNK